MGGSHDGAVTNIVLRVCNDADFGFCLCNIAPQSYASGSPTDPITALLNTTTICGVFVCTVSVLSQCSNCHMFMARMLQQPCRPQTNICRKRQERDGTQDTTTKDNGGRGFVARNSTHLLAYSGAFACLFLLLVVVALRQVSGATPTDTTTVGPSGSKSRTGLASLPPLDPGVAPHRFTISTVPARVTDEVFRLYVKYQVRDMLAFRPELFVGGMSMQIRAGPCLPLAASTLIPRPTLHALLKMDALARWASWCFMLCLR